MTENDLNCPIQGRCPGCTLGGVPYFRGLAEKGQSLAVALERYPELRPQLLPPRAAETTLAYRLRAKLVSRGQALGLFERGSHRVVDVSGCRVLSAAVARTTQAVRGLLPLPIYGADLRESSEGVLVTLLTEDAAARAELARAARGLVERGEALSVAISVRRTGDVRLLAGEPEVEAGPREARHALSAAAPYGYAAHGGFVQAHAGQASYVYAEIASGLRERLPTSSSPRVLELFAGNGSLALALTKAGARVTAVEAYGPAIRLAERAAREQRLELSAVADDAARFAERLKPGSFDAVVVNPPRRGLDRSLRRAIGVAAPRAFAYVSCNPHTLARDAWHFAELGLSLERAEPLDMIPWSDAVEVLAWFRPAPPPPPRVLFEDAECLAIDVAPHHEREHHLRRVQTLPGCERAVALDQWGSGVSGVRWFAKAPGRDFQVAERELTLLVRGNLRKQGTIRRARAASSGAKYKKLADVGRHSLVSVLSGDSDERGTRGDFAGIRHPILGESAQGDSASNEFLLHRHGLDRAFVHVTRSQLRLPSQQVVSAESALAPDLSRVLESLGSDETAL